MSSKEIWLIRHAESQGNIGEITKSNEENPLSENGKKQAEKLASFLREYPRPGLVVHSPYIRTIQTAFPFLHKYGYGYSNEKWLNFHSNPNKFIEIEEWPVQEFTYLSKTKYANTSINDRLGARQKFWEKNDPNYRDDSSSESINDLLGRAHKTINKIWASTYKRTYIFSHGQFIKTIMILLQCNGFNYSFPTMEQIRHYFESINIPNTGILQLMVDSENIWMASNIGVPGSTSEPKFI